MNGNTSVKISTGLSAMQAQKKITGIAIYTDGGG